MTDRAVRRLALLACLTLFACVLPGRAVGQAPTASDGAEANAADAQAAGAPATGGGADTVEALFRRANELAFAENYPAALEVYGALTDVGIVDPDVEQNIAVCHARAGDLPRAIYHFERALLLSPGDEAIELSLAAAEDALARARAEAEGEAELSRDTHFAGALVRGVSERALALTLLLSVGMLCVALAVRRRLVAEVPRVAGSMSALSLALVACAAGAGLVVKQGWLRDGTDAVILGDSVPLHQSPDARSPVLATPARGGERATVLDEYEGFVRVRLGARQGWAPHDEVGSLQVTR